MSRVHIKRISGESSRVSSNFKISASSGNLMVDVEGVAKEHVPQISFAIMENVLFSSACVKDHLHSGMMLDAKALTNKNLYIGRLRYEIPGSGKMEHHNALEHLNSSDFHVVLRVCNTVVMLRPRSDMETKMCEPFLLSTTQGKDTKLHLVLDGLPPHVLDSTTFDVHAAAEGVSPAVLVQSHCKSGQTVTVPAVLHDRKFVFSNLAVELEEAKLTATSMMDAFSASVLVHYHTERLHHMKNETSRVSGNFEFPASGPPGTNSFSFRIVSDLPPEHRDKITFAVMQKPNAFSKSKCLIEKCYHGRTLPITELAGKSQLYFGRLELDGRLSCGEVFQAIQQSEILIAISFTQPLAVCIDSVVQGSLFTCPSTFDKCVVCVNVPPQIKQAVSFSVLSIPVAVATPVGNISASPNQHALAAEAQVIREGGQGHDIELQQWQVSGKQLCVGKLKLQLRDNDVFNAFAVDKVCMKLQVVED